MHNSHILKHFTIVLLFCFSATGLWAQWNKVNWSAQLNGGMEYMLNTFDSWGEMMNGHTYPMIALRMAHNTDSTSRNRHAAIYGYPAYGFEVSWRGIGRMDYTGKSHLSDITTMAAFFERDFVRTQHFSAGYTMQVGLGFNSAVFDSIDNPQNDVFSAAVLIFIGAGLQASYRPSEHWEIGLGARVGHFSAGRLSYPNKGLNEVGANLSLRYRQKPIQAWGPRPHFEPQRRLFGEIYAGGGLHRCKNEWNAFGRTSPWAIASMGGSVNYRILDHISTGLSLDYFNVSRDFLNRLEAADRILQGDEKVDKEGRYERNSGGVSFLGQFNYGNFSFITSLGCYVYRHHGLGDDHGLLYQRAGVKYVMPQLGNLFLAVNVYSHYFSRAYFMEFTTGFRL